MGESFPVYVAGGRMASHHRHFTRLYQSSSERKIHHLSFSAPPCTVTWVRGRTAICRERDTGREHVQLEWKPKKEFVQLVTIFSNFEKLFLFKYAIGVGRDSTY